jgi:hypothetical protein
MASNLRRTLLALAGAGRVASLTMAAQACTGLVGGAEPAWKDEAGNADARVASGCDGGECLQEEPCSTPITVIENPPLIRGSGWFFVLDFNCPQLEWFQSPVLGTPPNESSYRSTGAHWKRA